MHNSEISRLTDVANEAIKASDFRMLDVIIKGVKGLELEVAEFLAWVAKERTKIVTVKQAPAQAKAKSGRSWITDSGFVVAKVSTKELAEILLSAPNVPQSVVINLRDEYTPCVGGSWPWYDVGIYETYTPCRLAISSQDSSLHDSVLCDADIPLYNAYSADGRDRLLDAVGDGETPKDLLESVIAALDWFQLAYLADFDAWHVPEDTTLL